MKNDNNKKDKKVDFSDGKELVKAITESAIKLHQEPNRQESDDDLDFDVYDYEITDSTIIEPLQPIITIEESIFCAKGEISFISGKPKVGKTTIVSILVSTYLTQDPQFDTLGFVSHFQGNEKVFFIDTEQSKRSTKLIIERVKRNLNVSSKPDNFRIFNFRSLGHLEVKKAFAKLLNDHSDTTLWVIDGISEMVSSVNDEKEASELLKYLGKIVDKYNCAMIVFIHENSKSTNEKMRGHLGSEAQRKCFATISVSRDDKTKTHTIKAVDFRESGHFEDIFLRYDTEMKTFVRLDAHEMEVLSKQQNDEKLNELYELASVLKPDEKVTYTELTKRIQQYKGFKERTAKGKIPKMVEAKVLQKIEEKYNNGKTEIFYSLFSPLH